MIVSTIDVMKQSIWYSTVDTVSNYEVIMVFSQTPYFLHYSHVPLLYIICLFYILLLVASQH